LVARHKHKALKREPVAKALTVYRFMRRDSMDLPVLSEECMSAREEREASDCECDQPDGRERKLSILQDGRSAWRTKAHALKRWRQMRRNAERRGEALELVFIAKMVLSPGEEFYFEELGSDGHLTIWGCRTKLAEAVRRVDDVAAGIGE
jgi:hypothetical protein